ncbi:MAG: hypothetical protein ACOCZ6_04865 [Nanoarchaeota archaeon]
MVYRIGVCGTDARTLLSALVISTAKGSVQTEEMKGVIVRGTHGMEKYSLEKGWPVDFIETADNSVNGYADTVTKALLNRELDLVMPMPEKLLFNGFVDLLEKNGLSDKVIGLKESGAFVEGDKIECKKLCAEYNIPVAEWCEVDARDYKAVLEETLKMINRFGGAVIKYPYSASGKGARIILDAWEIRDVYSRLIFDYKETYKSMFGKKKWPLLIESRMSGAEISFTTLVDKHGNYRILPTSLDYPERFPGPASRNNPITGGMGSISPHPMETSFLFEMAGKKIIDPFIKALKEKDILRPCVLYPGCIVSFDSFMKPVDIRMCEMNIRPGEPEFQTVAKRTQNLGELLKATIEGNLINVEPETRKNQVSLCSALVVGPGGEEGRKGYPWSSVRRETIEIDTKYLNKKKLQLIPSAMEHDGNNFISNGGRVCYLTANSEVSDNENFSDASEKLRIKILSSLRNDKVKLVRTEDKGNRFQLREDIGAHYKKAEEIFNF